MPRFLYFKYYSSCLPKRQCRQVRFLSLTSTSTAQVFVLPPATGHTRQAKDTNQTNIKKYFYWIVQNMNTIALVEPAWLADRLYEVVNKDINDFRYIEIVLSLTGMTTGSFV